MDKRNQYKQEVFKCDLCQKTIEPKIGSCSTGYATLPAGHRACYACCAIQDEKEMKRHGRIVLYYDGKKVTNWPGTLEFVPISKSTGKHNMAGKRYDVWFAYNQKVWHGVTYGDNTQLCHCRETKQSTKSGG